MAKYYLDSSALTKRYKRTESGSNFVSNLFSGGHQLFYLNLAIIEVRKVFYRLRHHPQSIEGDVQTSDADFQLAQNQFAADLQQMQRVVLTEEMISNTETILQNHWLKSAFDLAHLSAFLITRQEHPDIILVSADGPMCDVARQLVSTTDVINPEEQEKV